MEQFKYYTINYLAEYGESCYGIYGWGVYPRTSVLAGQARKVFVESFDTIEAAQAAYPGANESNKWTEPQVSLNHLPSEDDPIAGGMYPDDCDGGW